MEDNPGDALLIKEALRDVTPPAFELFHVDRFNKAMRSLQERPFGALLLDLSLPDASGIDMMFILREKFPSVPIVVLTGLDDDQVAVEAVRAGAQDYLVKGQIDGRLLVRSVTYAMERKRLYETTERRLQKITVLKDINAALTSSLDLSVVLDILMNKIISLMPHLVVTIRLRNKADGALEPVGCRNIDEQEWKSAAERWKSAGSLSEVVVAQREPMVIEDLPNDPRVRDLEFCLKHAVVCYLGLPLMADDEVIGLIACYSRTPAAFSDEDIEFLGALAGQASVAIRNSKVHGEIRGLVGDLERANSVKDEFLGVISHELRTPLNVVKGYIEMLQGGFFGDITPDQQAALEKVAKQTRIQLGMINNILNAITVESDIAKARHETLILPKFFDQLQNAYPQPVDKKIEFCWDFSPMLPAVKTDKVKLQYILQNLINNAIKFTPEGLIRVSAKLVDDPSSVQVEAPGAYSRTRLVIVIADSGIGIDAAGLPLIFEKFSQVDSSLKRAHEGIGLGLFIVKRCTDILNGTVTVQSEFGKGTTFTVDLPCEVVDPPATADETPSQHAAYPN